MPKTALVILAAGNSSRLGYSKQMLTLSNGLSLLVQTIEIGLASEVSEIIVVLGADYETHFAHLVSYQQQIQIVENKDWARGMGSSIKAGINYLLSKPYEINSVIVSVCDQPFLNASIFNALIDSDHLKSSSMIVSRYDKQNYGVPVLFKKRWFHELTRIPDPNGAMFLLKRYPSAIGEIPFERGNIDIDTNEDVLLM